MALSTALQAIFDRLKTFYNGSTYSPTGNPGGFSRGGNQPSVDNFSKALRDFADFGKGIADLGSGYADLLQQLQAATAAAAASGAVVSVNGMAGVVNLPDLPSVLPPVIASPVSGSTPALSGGALPLAVDGFRPLYPKTQKSIQFQVAASASGFASPIHDSGAVAGTALSASITNAQTKFTGGTTYYLRARQTDQDDFMSGWSAVTTFVFPRVPAAPTMSAPANNATGVGAQNANITLTASAYSHPSSTAQAGRRFELSKDNFATIVTVNGTVGQASATLTSPKDVLTANTVYKVRCVDTDTNGGVATSAATSFTTAAVFRPNPGDPWQGGFYVGQISVSSTTYDLIVASKSNGESTGAWYNAGSATIGTTSRVNGPANSSTQSSSSAQYEAARFCENLTANGYSDWYLPAIDELEIAYRNLKPSTTTNAAGQGANSNSVPAGAAYTSSIPAQTSAAAFQSGGAEAFETLGYWSSTEASASNANYILFSQGNQQSDTKTQSLRVRAFRRVAV